ncbi:hypothetical protein AQS8620_00125 [Aquimixticola soesokkakensis]|uniref:Capsule polysaccharide biosynthesis protein n=1 Tax=Aquimixticola soesokkakensis TaxID=1519096 RepID=A0A1Y5RCW1_9RHOB|nr:hypothetical protein [Aquimixticola soesokkakensis]SLN11988.1 hypothetical protein AQS8620_00125 [Aquimixticola soesokkakensis]
MSERSSHSTAHIFLSGPQHARAVKGNHRFVAQIRTALHSVGWDSQLRVSALSDVLQAADDNLHSLHYREEPHHPRGLSFRTAYFTPFWNIERTNERWNYAIAHEDFDPNGVDRDDAQRFLQRWKREAFGSLALGQGQGQGGFVYVPLQGVLLNHRSFQSTSPIDMLRAVLKHEKTRKVIAAFHPREFYSEEERRAVEALARAEPRLDLRVGQRDALLAGCDYIVTENSSVGFAGLFFHKPVVLFAQIDFHHICLNVRDLGAEEAIRLAPDHAPDFAAYVTWFLRRHAVNARHPRVSELILNRLRAGGWAL